MKIYIEVPAGQMWHHLAEKMLDVANATKEPVYATFNEIEFAAKPGGCLADMAVDYDNKRGEWLRQLSLREPRSMSAAV